MKKTERLVHFYDLKIDASCRNFDAPKSISVQKAVQLMELVPIDQRVRESAKGHELQYISDWDRTDNTVSILLNKSDKSISDPIFTVPREGKRRVAEKEDNEGQDFSVHIVIRLPEDVLNPALLIMEYCPGLSLLSVERVLNRILADAKKLSPEEFTQNHPDGSLDANGKPKKINVTFKCRLEGHLSDELKDDLNNGKIQSIELITDKTKHTPFDEDGYITEKCKTVTLNVNEDKPSAIGKFERMMNVITQHKTDYDQAKIRFKSPEGLDRTVDIDPSDGIAQLYIKKVRLDSFQTDLKSSYAKFNPETLLKMKALLN